MIFSRAFWFGFVCCIILQQSQSLTIDEIIANAVEETGANAEASQDSDTVLVELDILYTKDEWQQIQELSQGQTSRVRRTKRKALRSLSHRWTNKVVPYMLSNVFTPGDLSEINAAITELETHTCIDFRPATESDTNYIFLQNGGGCSSFLGMIGGRQPINLAPGCRYKGTVVHELGHALGFRHEQARPDRDNFVTIQERNIRPGKQHNFLKYSTEDTNVHSVPYDYRSIMHYGPKYFSRNDQPTIVTKDPAFQNVIGNRDALSFRDIKLSNLMYRCNAQCPSKSCPGEGFVGKDCECWCPGNPVTKCVGSGDNCNTVSGNGPHNTKCLKEWWLEVGCTAQGTHSPHNLASNVAWWNARTVAAVQADMGLYRQYADENRGNYFAKCFDSENCARVNGNGPHNIKCLKEWWLEVGCTAVGISSPHNLPSNVAWWNARSVAAVKADMRLYKQYADAGTSNYFYKCYGSGNCARAVGTGPHNTACLKQWWLEVGCTAQGTHSPHNLASNVAWWNARTVAAVKADMRLYKQYANEGRSNYYYKCYGSGNCALAIGAGPHNTECLKQWWLEVGCTAQGTHSPHNLASNVAWWNARTVAAVKADMRLYKQYANEGRSSYFYKCYGSGNCALPFGNGPHNTECLKQWWLEVGCTAQGISSPHNLPSNVAWWNARTVAAVKADMRLYKQYANEGRGNYRRKCYG